MSNASGLEQRKSKVSMALVSALVLTTAAAVPVWATEWNGPGGGASQFHTLDNPGDLNFNQLLGINDGGTIVGYFGDAVIVPNNGYVLVPQNHYAVENYTNLPAGDVASQTQAIGINNRAFPDIVGFYTDNATGFTHGFLDSNGVQTAIDDPAGVAPNVTAPAQNLLGINDFGKAAGFWMDNNGHEHGFVVSINSSNVAASKFTEIPPTLFPGGIATQASGITDSDHVCGFWTDANGNNHGFFGRLGYNYDSFRVEIHGAKAVSTSPFGCNNTGEIVGSFTDAQGAVHGFIYRHGKFKQLDAPGSSQTAAFGVSGTLINGINDQGDIVGFYSDGTKVHGFTQLTSTLDTTDTDD